MIDLRLSLRFYPLLLLLIACSALTACKVYQKTGPAEQRPQKVQVCHQGTTMRLDDAAVRAHLDHGDRLGACR